MQPEDSPPGRWRSRGASFSTTPGTQLSPLLQGSRLSYVPRGSQMHKLVGSTYKETWVGTMA